MRCFIFAHECKCTWIELCVHIASHTHKSQVLVHIYVYSGGHAANIWIIEKPQNGFIIDHICSELICICEQAISTLLVNIRYVAYNNMTCATRLHAGNRQLKINNVTVITRAGLTRGTYAYQQQSFRERVLLWSSILWLRCFYLYEHALQQCLAE